MQKISVYGKGGIGKSMIATNLSASYALRGRRVLHMGCDPKADSAVRLMEHQGKLRTVLEVMGDDPTAVGTADILNEGRHGIHCCEAGGPKPGLGCGGRGVARAIEVLDELGIMESDRYDVALFDVLGDVVCGGFAAPLRARFADKVVIVLSEEPMAVYAANNIASAVRVYERNGARLAGLVLNLRSNDIDPAPFARFAQRLGTRFLATVLRDPLIMEAERNGSTVVEYAPDSASAHLLAALGETLWDVDTRDLTVPTPIAQEEIFDFLRELG